jgi:hypothetical protein
MAPARMAAMNSRLSLRLGITALAFVAGFGVTFSLVELKVQVETESEGEAATADRPSTIPDRALPAPQMKQPASVGSLTFVFLLVTAAVGALWLSRRQSGEQAPGEETEIPGPRLVFERREVKRRRSLEFYEDLRRRETVLEGLEGTGAGRVRRKVVELPDGESRSPRTSG